MAIEKFGVAPRVIPIHDNEKNQKYLKHYFQNLTLASTPPYLCKFVPEQSGVVVLFVRAYMKTHRITLGFIY